MPYVLPQSFTDKENHCLRQVNEVNGGDNLFIRCVCVCVCVCVCARSQRTGQSDQFEKVKAKDFKFEVHVPKYSPDMIP